MWVICNNMDIHPSEKNLNRAKIPWDGGLFSTSSPFPFIRGYAESVRIARCYVAHCFTIIKE
jgi:hypothetical protein